MPRRGDIVVERLTGGRALVTDVAGPEEVTCRFGDGRLEERFAFELAPALPNLEWLVRMARGLRPRLRAERGGMWHARALRWEDQEPPQEKSAETRARRWLAKLIPSQAERYLAKGFVDVRSTLVPGRRYRIYWGPRQTEIYEGRRKVALSCLQLVDLSLPSTDRVIAEYFLIRGDEQRYLATAHTMGWRA